MEQRKRIRAGELMLAAARIEAEHAASSKSGPNFALARECEQATARAAQARDRLPERINETGAGGELVPREAFGFKAPELVNTVADPDYVAADASRDRLELADQAGCLDLALDAADTIDAQN